MWYIYTVYIINTWLYSVVDYQVYFVHGRIYWSVSRVSFPEGPGSFPRHRRPPESLAEPHPCALSRAPPQKVWTCLVWVFHDIRCHPVDWKLPLKTHTDICIYIDTLCICINFSVYIYICIYIYIYGHPIHDSLVKQCCFSSYVSLPYPVSWIIPVKTGFLFWAVEGVNHQIHIKDITNKIHWLTSTRCSGSHNSYMRQLAKLGSTLKKYDLSYS